MAAPNIEITPELPKNLTEQDRTELFILLNELERRKKGNLIATFFTDKDRPAYLKHVEFFRAGLNFKQRLFRAANRVGKTTAAAFELVCHMTGNYPDWWEGKRFDVCSAWWVCGNRGETIRQILQPLLLGPVGAFGTGMIPMDLLDFDSLKDAKKAATSIGTIRVRHKTGAFSLLEFKAYEQGRSAFEGTERSIWCDEEPPMDVYAECLLRTMTGGNILMMTFTPLKGASDVVYSFSNNGIFEDGPVTGMKDEKGRYADVPAKWCTTCTWDDVPHLSEAEKAELWNSIPPYQRDARTKGVPALGSGVVYPVPEDEYLIDLPPGGIPAHWPRNYGMDVGGKTAAVWVAKDPDTGLLYTYTSYYKEREEPTIHAAGIKSRGDWIPGAIDPASRGRSQIDGNQLMQMYRDLGLKLTDAENAVEAGLYTMWDMLSTGRLKVVRGQEQFMREIRSYARDDKGKIIKTNDHLMDAWRYAVMTRDIAKTALESGRQRDPNRNLPTEALAW